MKIKSLKVGPFEIEITGNGILTILGLFLLLYSVLLALFPSWRIGAVRLFFEQHISFLPDWFLSLIAGIALVSFRPKLIRDLYLALSGRPSLHTLFETEVKPFRTFLGAEQEEISVNNILECDQLLIDELNKIGIKTKAQLLESVNTIEKINQLAKRLRLKKVVIERITYFSFTRPEFIRRQIIRTRSRTLILMIMVVYSFTVVMWYSWLRMNKLQNSVQAEEVYKEAIAKINCRLTEDEFQKDLINRARRSLSSIGAIATSSSNCCRDLLMWFFTEFEKKKGQKDIDIFLNEFLQKLCVKGPLSTDVYALQGRIAFVLSNDGQDTHFVNLSRLLFNAARNEDLTNCLALNGKVACDFLEGLCEDRPTERWRLLSNCLESINDAEVCLKMYRPPYSAFIYSKIWNNKGYTLLQMFNDYWCGGDPGFFIRSGYTKRYPDLSRRPEVFLDSVRVLFDYAITHEFSNPIFYVSMAQSFLVQAKYDYFVRKQDTATVYQKLEQKATPLMDQAKALGWDGRGLWSDGYKRRLHFDILDTLGHIEWLDRYRPKYPK